MTKIDWCSCTLKSTAAQHMRHIVRHTKDPQMRYSKLHSKDPQMFVALPIIHLGWNVIVLSDCDSINSTFDCFPFYIWHSHGSDLKYTWSRSTLGTCLENVFYLLSCLPNSTWQRQFCTWNLPQNLSPNLFTLHKYFFFFSFSVFFLNPHTKKVSFHDSNYNNNSDDD